MYQAQQQLGQWLQELSLDTGKPFQLDDLGQCHLQGGDNVDLTLAAPEGDTFYLSAGLGPVPADNRGTVLYHALVMNLFQAETLGASIAIDPGSNLFLLCYSSPVQGLDFQDFHNLLNNFVSKADHIRSLLAEAMMQK